MSRISSLLIITILLFSLAVYPATAAKQVYKQTNLVSDIPGLAQFTDPNLVNPWGLAIYPIVDQPGPWWISDNGMGISTLYDKMGNINPLVVNIPPRGSSPTGVVFSGGSGFMAKFIFVSEDGRVTAWNNSDPTNAVIRFDNSAGNAVYKGVTMASIDPIDPGRDPYLYVADFHNGRIDVFDRDFNQVSLGGNFKDSNIPTGYAPFNIVNINGDLFVTFAKQNAQKHDDVAGPRHGYVDKFSPDGKLLMRLKHGPWMNSPWGVALSPNNFGKFSNQLLVGNFGSGQIAAFDPTNGDFNGFLKDNKGRMTIDGLWALVFGNDADAGPSNVLFFTAGINGEQNGLFGTISQN